MGSDSFSTAVMFGPLIAAIVLIVGVYVWGRVKARRSPPLGTSGLRPYDPTLIDYDTEHSLRQQFERGVIDRATFEERLADLHRRQAS